LSDINNTTLTYQDCDLRFALETSPLILALLSSKEADNMAGFALPVPLIPNFLPPSATVYTNIVLAFSLFPLFALLQFLTPWYPMGKTAYSSSIFNLPGRIGWVTMEVPGMASLSYVLYSLPRVLGLIPQSAPLSLSLWLQTFDVKNAILASMFISHYINRAVVSPIWLNPSMSPIHLFVWFSALVFQLSNGISMGSWLGGYGPRRGDGYWEALGEVRFWTGVVIWAVGLLGNIYHDELLRNLRRPGAKGGQEVKNEVKRDLTATPAKSTRSKTKKPTQSPVKSKGKSKENNTAPSTPSRYQMPTGGLFHLVLYPHYLLEWIEWIGFWIAAGPDCSPARNFVLNEVLSMAPRAWNGWYWYVEKFGREKVGDRKAVIPWLF
jgi:3-oxo-5-alpha-steroid 4-dehydrogenase 1